MNFMGAKTKFCKYIIPILQNYIDENNITRFYDVFCGGANVADKINNCTVIANDMSPTLIALHRQMQEDSTILPEHGSREWWDEAYTEYKRLKNFSIYNWGEESNMDLYLIGAIEWYASYARGGFPRGYAKNTDKRDYYNEGYRNHLKQSESKNFKNITFLNFDYKDLQFELNQLIYCDPPYKNTKPYAINPKFNHEEFYNWCREVSKTNPIFISEQYMPEDFKVIWNKDGVVRTCSLKNDYKASETLYFIDNRSQD